MDHDLHVHCTGPACEHVYEGKDFCGDFRSVIFHGISRKATDLNHLGGGFFPWAAAGACFRTVLTQQRDNTETINESEELDRV